MLDTLIFDLDDTLLVNPMDTFLPPYFKALSAYLAAHVPGDRLVPELLRATQVMMANRDAGRTNAEVFATAFYPALGLAEADMLPLLERFYEEEFPKLQAYTRAAPEARPLLAAAQARGYGLVIATNPVFPLRAIQHRLDWAGVGDFPYLYVTSYETMHFTKPHPEYYQEILDHIQRRAERCLMVGNEPDNDIRPARVVGMRTFLALPDAPAGVSSGKTGAAEYQGTLSDLRRLIETEGLRRGE